MRDEHVPTDVFPTCVGVFLYEQYVKLAFRRLPHVRGGVSGGALGKTLDT